MSRLLACPAIVVAAIVTIAAADRSLVRRDAYLMGTRAVLAVYAADREAGHAALEAALDVLEETDRQLSTWRQQSAISRLNRTPVGTPWTAEDGLCRLFSELFHWHDSTQGAFDPGGGSLAYAWGLHDGGRIPSPETLADARRRSGLALFDFDAANCTVVRRVDATLDVGAFGKGEALDRVAASMATADWMVDLGGQVSVGGTRPAGPPWAVDIAHPLDRTRAVMSVQLRSGSLSTSGGSERDTIVDGIRIGHILDPRTGTPAPFHGSVVVWHERGLVADIVSTALYVMGPAEGLRWAEARGIAAAFLIPERSPTPRVAATPRFRDVLNPTGRE